MRRENDLSRAPRERSDVRNHGPGRIPEIRGPPSETIGTGNVEGRKGRLALAGLLRDVEIVHALQLSGGRGRTGRRQVHDGVAGGEDHAADFGPEHAIEWRARSKDGFVTPGLEKGAKPERGPAGRPGQTGIQDDWDSLNRLDRQPLRFRRKAGAPAPRGPEQAQGGLRRKGRVPHRVAKRKTQLGGGRVRRDEVSALNGDKLWKRRAARTSHHGMRLSLGEELVVEGDEGRPRRVTGREG